MSTLATERQSQQGQQISVAQRYASMNPQSFGEEIQKFQKYVTSLTSVLQENVEQGNVRPIDAIRTLSCATASVLGYEEFHPRNSGQGWDAAVSMLSSSGALSGADTPQGGKR